MTGWFLKGIQTGIKTTRYPQHAEQAGGTWVGFPVDTEFEDSNRAQETTSHCPTGALKAEGKRVLVDSRLCIHCFRCVRGAPTPMRWSNGPLPGRVVAAHDPRTMDPARSTGASFGLPFRRSVNILVVDAGDCGACLNEVRQLNAPQYNMHRLGFFITPTPRQADVLVVVGQVTDAMREPLCAAYRAMPDPKRVAAVGGCALSGAPVGPSFTAGSGVHEFLPVDIEVPGSPPTPLSILRALLVLSGRSVESWETKA